LSANRATQPCSGSLRADLVKVDEARVDLAAFLATPAPREWQAQSLCSEWSVKDVVAHVVCYEEVTPLGLAQRFAKGLVIHANEVGVQDFAGN
jgi:hypothetical protein